MGQSAHKRRSRKRPSGEHGPSAAFLIRKKEILTYQMSKMAFLGEDDAELERLRR